MARRDSEQSRENILLAAMAEFAAKGYGGARVDAIALRANINKRMLYHYYGSKEDLFLAVLEHTYAAIRSNENALDLEHKDPTEAVVALVAFTFDHFHENPEFIRLLNAENLYKAANLKRSKKIRGMHFSLIAKIEELMTRGVKKGVFRSDVDAIQLYITITSVSYFYLSNAHTLSTIFGRNLLSRAALKIRRDHCIDVVMGYLRP